MNLVAKHLLSTGSPLLHMYAPAGALRKGDENVKLC